MPRSLKPMQFGLASLFAFTTLAAVGLWAWRFGPLKLAAIIAITTGVFFVVLWCVLLARKLFR